MKVATTALLLASAIFSSGAFAADMAADCGSCKPMQAGDAATTQAAINVANSSTSLAVGDRIDIFHLRYAPNGAELYRTRHFLVGHVPVFSSMDLEDMGAEFEVHDLAIVPGPYGTYAASYLIGIWPTVTVYAPITLP